MTRIVGKRSKFTIFKRVSVAREPIKAPVIAKKVGCGEWPVV